MNEVNLTWLSKVMDELASVKILYEQYLIKHSKPLSRLHDSRRVKKFQESLQLILDHKVQRERKKRYPTLNEHIPTYDLSINEFADIFDNEKKSLLGVDRNNFLRWNNVSMQTVRKTPKNTDLLSSSRKNSGVALNWASDENPYRTKLINVIRNQGVCGACWAFVTASAVEAATKLSILNDKRFENYTANLIDQVPSLSAQQLLDCDQRVNRGCEGGNPYLGLNYALVHGVVSEDVYSYKFEVHTISYLDNIIWIDIVFDQVEQCKLAQHAALYNKERRYFVSEVRTLKPFDEDELLLALIEDGPISVGLCGTDQSFLLYSSGIYNPVNCCAEQNHAMLIVGYGYDAEVGVDYWILQNRYAVKSLLLSELTI